MQEKQKKGPTCDITLITFRRTRNEFIRVKQAKVAKNLYLFILCKEDI